MSERTFLRTPWENLERQHVAVSFGMWVFLASEILLFAGLFGGYSIYRSLYPHGLRLAARLISCTVPPTPPS
ncbi:MAG TPA: hypothetical protein VLC74_11385 [Rhizomicrobium sp.]|nr:hypothetical protein [Rhizomicrobium sp.]